MCAGSTILESRETVGVQKRAQDTPVRKSIGSSITVLTRMFETMIESMRKKKKTNVLTTNPAVITFFSLSLVTKPPTAGNERVAIS